MRNRIMLYRMLALGLMNTAAMAQSVVEAPAVRPDPQSMELNLAKSFHTRSAWRFVVTEGAPDTDFGGNDAPGILTLCLHKGPAGPCVSEPVTLPLRKTTPDDPMLAIIHASLKPRELLPAEHLVDKGYTDAQVLVDSQHTYGMTLIGPVADDPGWQAREGTGFAKAHFQVDWERQIVTCPMGKERISWLPH